MVERGIDVSRMMLLLDEVRDRETAKHQKSLEATIVKSSLCKRIATHHFAVEISAVERTQHLSPSLFDHSEKVRRSRAALGEERILAVAGVDAGYVAARRHRSQRALGLSERDSGLITVKQVPKRDIRRIGLEHRSKMQSKGRE